MALPAPPALWAFSLRWALASWPWAQLLAWCLCWRVWLSRSAPSRSTCGRPMCMKVRQRRSPPSSPPRQRWQRLRSPCALPCLPLAGRLQHGARSSCSSRWPPLWWVRSGQSAKAISSGCWPIRPSTTLASFWLALLLARLRALRACWSIWPSMW